MRQHLILRRVDWGIIDTMREVRSPYTDTWDTMLRKHGETGSPTRLYIDIIWVVFKILISQFFPGDSHTFLYAVWMLEIFVLFLLWRQGSSCWWQTLELPALVFHVFIVQECAPCS